MSHLGVGLQRRDPRCNVKGVLVHHRLEAVLPPWPAWRWSRSWLLWCCSATASCPRCRECFRGSTPSSTLRADWSALFERPVVSELCSADAAPVRSQSWSWNWMAAALLPDAAVFTQVCHLRGGVRARASPVVTCVPSVTSPLSRTWQLPQGAPVTKNVQNLRDVPGDGSFKHVFLGGCVFVAALSYFYNNSLNR